MNRLLCWGLVLASILFSACSNQKGPENANEEIWIQLFDGTSLNGWTPKIRGYEFGDNFAETFTVRDSAISVSYEGYDTFGEKFGHLFYVSPFSFYRLAVEYRFTGEQAPDGPGWAYRNSGIMIHSPPGETMLIDQDFPISIEVQLLGGNGEDERSNSNLCTPGTNVVMDGELVTRHCVSSTSTTYHGDQWVRAEIVVLGDSLISHFLGGEEVLQYTKPQMGGGNVDSFDPEIKVDGQVLTGGFISLQSESHPVEFRKVELLNLKGCMDPKATKYKSYFVNNDVSMCFY
jgi:hypothetical protein